MTWSQTLMNVAMVTLVLLLTISLVTSETEPRRRNSNGVRRRPVSSSDTLGWMCPQVLCPEVPSSCQIREVIVFEYNYRIRGRLVTVRCQSCPYCLDFPFANRRTRRSLPDLSQILTPRNTDVGLWEKDPEDGQGEALCSRFNCLSVSAMCGDVRDTSVFIRGNQCCHCPACYDNMIIDFEGDTDTV